MKIQVMKTSLLEALMPLAKINTPTKHLAITSKGKTVTLSVIGEKAQLEMDMPLARIDADGACTVDITLLKATLESTRTDNIELEPRQGRLLVRADGRLAAELPCKEDATRMTALPVNADSTSLPTGFAGFLLQAFQSAGKDAARPVLMGVNVSKAGIAGTDGKRLTHIPLPLSLKSDVTLPPSPIYAALRKYRWASLSHWDEWAAITGAGFRLVLKRQDGVYPNYHALHARKDALDITAEISAADVPKAVEFMESMPKAEKGFMPLWVLPNCVHLADSKRSISIAARSNAKAPCGIYCNSAYLLQALGLGHTRLALSSRKPDVVSAEGGTGNFLFMPINGRPDIPPTAETATVAVPASNTKNTPTTKETKTMTTTIQPVPAPVAAAFRPAATTPLTPQQPTEPLAEIAANLAAMREHLDNLSSRLNEAARKIREAQVLQRQKERQYADANRKLERIRLAV